MIKGKIIQYTNDNGEEKSISLKALRDVIDLRYFYIVDVQVDEYTRALKGVENEDYKKACFDNYINWSKMAVEVHEMSDDDFMDKIVNGHSNYPSLDDFGFHINEHPEKKEDIVLPEFLGY